MIRTYLLGCPSDPPVLAGRAASARLTLTARGRDAAAASRGSLSPLGVFADTFHQYYQYYHVDY